MTNRDSAAPLRRVEMSTILNVLKPLDATSCATTNRKRRLIANVCRLIGDELTSGAQRNGAATRASLGTPPARAPRNDQAAAAARETGPRRRASGHGIAVAGQTSAQHVPPGNDFPAEEHLSPRLRQTLQSLLAGDSEKQVAQKLGLSTHTVHVYVKKLYRRFGVSSRGELLAKWVTR